MKAYDYLKNELEPEEEPELEEEFKEEFEEEELDEMEEDVKLLQSELHDVEKYSPSIKEAPKEPFTPYLISVLNNNVSRREAPGKNNKANGRVVKNDIFKILEEATDENGLLWGKTKFGWIPISDCRKL